MTDAREWRYLENGQERGPASEELLRSILEGGDLPPDTLVWTPEMKEWAPASDVFGGGDAARVQSRFVAPPVKPLFSYTDDRNEASEFRFFDRHLTVHSERFGEGCETFDAIPYRSINRVRYAEAADGEKSWTLFYIYAGDLELSMRGKKADLRAIAGRLAALIC
jgi:hypothetical protein